MSLLGSFKTCEKLNRNKFDFLLMSVFSLALTDPLLSARALTVLTVGRNRGWRVTAYRIRV